MSESLPLKRLPGRPNLNQLRKQAKELQTSGEFPNLVSAQHALARQYGFASWPKLKSAVESLTLQRWIAEGDANSVQTLLAASPKLAATPFSDGGTPLHLAAECDSAEMIGILVSFGAKLHDRYAHSSHTALSWAVTNQSLQAAHRLIELGDEPDLFCAAGVGLLGKVRAFWKDGNLRPNPSRTGSSRYTESGERLPCPPERDEDQVSDALYIACRVNQPDVARWLLDHGANPNWRGFGGATCLAWAEFSGNPELCALLRKCGGSDDIIEPEFRATPNVFGMMVLAAWGFADRLRARLAANPSLVHIRGGFGTLLNAAAYNGQTECCKVLLELGVDKTARNAAGLTAAQMAAARGYAELSAILE